MPADTSRDLVLNPGEYAYMQDQTKGSIKTFVGPTVVNQTGQDRPVVFDKGRFLQARSLEDAVRQSPRAEEGQYLVLESPAQDGKSPQEGTSTMLPTLLEGRKLNIPGPFIAALWPGQAAKVIPGHNLRSNQFLQCRVYNDTEAMKNWSKSVMKLAPVKPVEGEEGKPAEKPAAPLAPIKVPKLVIGQHLIIPGTQVSFYIPPTGVEVVLDEGDYTQEAVTLERLEFCILIDEDGNKRYEKGPQVVFPKPTEEFWQDQSGARKFKAIELNTIQGLHIKVSAAYTEGNKQYKEGDEIFLTGKDTPIYYPRPEHNVIAYGDRAKHYAVAVPVGEGRYVMNRMSGQIKTTVGPLMLLPNPVEEVIVRRILTDRQCELWYPGNQEALDYNRRLRGFVQSADGVSNMGGQYIPESVVRTSYSNATMSFMAEEGSPVDYSGPGYRQDKRCGKGQTGQTGPTGVTGPTGAASALLADTLKSAGSRSGNVMKESGAAISRGTTFTKPRELTLDTKYDGVPIVQVWTGYAVKIVDRADKVKVVVGPQTVLLDYDQTLEKLTLSTGCPKTQDKLCHTAYLLTRNNTVSDILEVTTSDHVRIQLKLSYLVNFEGDPTKWFDIENYVKHLTDHVRSMLMGAVRHINIEKFYADGVGLVRNIVLGEKKGDEKRSGLLFPENGMHVVDVEVRYLAIVDENIRKLLDQAQVAAVQGDVQLVQAEKSLKVRIRLEDLSRQQDIAVFETQSKKLDLEQQAVVLQREVAAEKERAQLAAEDARTLLVGKGEATRNLEAKAKIDRYNNESYAEAGRQERLQEIRIAGIKAETEAVVAKFASCQGGFAQALTALSNSDTLIKIAEAMSVQKLIGGESMETILSSVFKGSHLEGVLERVMEQATALQVSKLNSTVVDKG